jgi:hypothetical protein
MLRSGTSALTTLPAATTAPSPTVTPPRTVTLRLDFLAELAQ